ncbi:MAG: hypothetical protein Q9166_000101 [cf. Caloplaca sp. 2 TL-2023]
MSEGLRGLVARKLSVVGVQLQDLWQKAWTSCQLFQRTLSPLPSQSANSPITKSDDDPSQEIFPTLSQTQTSNSSDPVLKDAGRVNLDQTQEALEAASAANALTHNMTTTAGRVSLTKDKQSQTTGSPNLLHRRSVLTDSDALPYTDASTQTELLSLESTPPTEYEDIYSHFDCGSGAHHHRGDDASSRYGSQNIKAHSKPSSTSSGKVRDDDGAPEIFDGPSRVVVSKCDDKDYLAILVTKEMIQRLENLSKESNQLEYSEPKFVEADQNVNVARINIDYCEDSLEDAQAQDVDELREDITRRRCTLRNDEKRRDDLEQRVVRLKRNVAYMEGLFAEMCQKVLTNAGLLEMDDEHVEEEESEGDDDGANGCTSPTGTEQYPVHQSDHSSVSIDELTRRAANEEVRQRHAELIEIEHEFDTRQEVYAKQNARFQRMVREGTCQMTQTEFDHADFEGTRGLTMDLREAEDKYEEETKSPGSSITNMMVIP